MPSLGYNKRFTEAAAWLKQILPTVDFAREELTYKVDFAEKLAATRGFLKANNPYWTRSFALAFVGSNLLNWRHTDALIHMSKNQPATLAALLQPLWEERLTDASFNHFVRGLHTNNARLTPGIGTTVASLMLMARGTVDHPPYRPEAVRRFWKAMGWPATTNNANPYLDYKNFLKSLQEFKTVASAHGLPVEDLLTAQGYMWLITEWDPRTVLPSSEIATFRAWRGDPYTGRSLEGSQATARRSQILEQLERNDSRLFTQNEITEITIHGSPANILHSSGGSVTPPGFELPVSITLSRSAAANPLVAEIDDSGLLRYPWKKNSRTPKADEELLSAMEARVPLAILAPLGNDTFQAVFPVYVHRSLQRDQVFELDLSDAYLPKLFGIAPEYERRWARATTRQRIHQPAFRRDVLRAYNNQCAVCGLGITSLLDAAHIIPDRDDGGIASANNGLALCKNHHAAFDAGLFTVATDLTIHISAPAMTGGSDEAADRLLKDYDGRKLAVIPDNPDWRPNPEFLTRK